MKEEFKHDSKSNIGNKTDTLDEKNTVTIIQLDDISIVQEYTEAYYVTKGLSERCTVRLITPFDLGLDTAVHHKIPGDTLVQKPLIGNVLLLSYLLYYSLRYEPDVFYTHHRGNPSAAIVSSLTGIPWIVDHQFHPTDQTMEFLRIEGNESAPTSLLFTVIDTIYTSVFRQSAAVVTVSEELAQSLQVSYGIESDSITVVPLAVDTTVFKPTTVSRESMTTTDIVYIGSVTMYRGLDTCIRALARDPHDETVLHIVGGGPETDQRRLKRLAADLDISDRVIFYGYVDHDQIPAVLNRMDIAVSPLPSHDSFEVSSPTKIYEYLAVGIPIVCTNITPHRRILTDGETGFFFDPNDQESLWRCIENISSFDGKELEELQERSREIAEENDWSTRLSIISSLVEDVING